MNASVPGWLVKAEADRRSAHLEGEAAPVWTRWGIMRNNSEAS